MQWSRYQCTCLQSFIKDCLTLVHTFSRILLQQLAKNATKFSELWCLFWVRSNALSTIRPKRFWNSIKFSIKYSINIQIKNLSWKLLKFQWYKNASATQGRHDIFLASKIATVAFTAAAAFYFSKSSLTSCGCPAKAEILQLNHTQFICRINFTDKKVGNRKI